MLKIPRFINKIISVLNNAGYEAYIVGGAVRDSLLGFSPTDYDITTSCPPQKIIELFENTAPTGIKHGTITVIIDQIPTEVTTFRIDGAYSDNRSPDSVTFTGNLADDLSRRDFTINAMAFCEEKGLTDLFGGVEDLKNNLIRTVGIPKKRFSEDALRIMRAIRFATTLNFSIEQETYDAAIKCADTLGLISAERINVELTKALLGENLSILERFINDGGLRFLNIENAANLKSISKLPSVLSLRIFAFLKLCHCQADHLNKRLKFSNTLCKELEQLCILNKELVSPDKVILKKALAKTDIQAILNYLEYLKIIKNEDITKYKENLNEIIKNNEPYLISHLAVDGDDLIKLGFKGTEIGITLNKLLKLVIFEPTLNNRTKLLERIK